MKQFLRKNTKFKVKPRMYCFNCTSTDLPLFILKRNHGIWMACKICDGTSGIYKDPCGILEPIFRPAIYNGPLHQGNNITFITNFGKYGKARTDNK
jgi:hypothetical protein